MQCKNHVFTVIAKVYSRDFLVLHSLFFSCLIDNTMKRVFQTLDKAIGVRLNLKAPFIVRVLIANDSFKNWTKPTRDMFLFCTTNYNSNSIGGSLQQH